MKAKSYWQHYREACIRLPCSIWLILVTIFEFLKEAWHEGIKDAILFTLWLIIAICLVVILPISALVVAWLLKLDEAKTIKQQEDHLNNIFRDYKNED